ncbi:galactokinase family protein [Rothia kristinae]|uniref:galactokinase family protein n=1 Tax=Rothia kristinae TaxID=37923 RepID=UPI001E2EEDA9|nr:galactokinase family protein [Rothia kristinae]
MGDDLAQQAWSDEQGTRAALELFQQHFDGRPGGVWAAPGRVHLIGDHVDYNDGTCLPMALPHRTFVAVARRSDTAQYAWSPVCRQTPRGGVTSQRCGRAASKDGWPTVRDPLGRCGKRAWRQPASMPQSCPAFPWAPVCRPRLRSSAPWVWPWGS